MKKKQLQELKNKPILELEKDLKSAGEELSKLRFDLKAGKVKNIKEIKSKKKMIARILTIINKKTK
ncbi:50S ribosomal protein L29 [Candidatus Wolfebacteria bacterium]|nr:50S ribosomal protein L29 [Candidatus Wolfebacteria bacterium]